MTRQIEASDVFDFMGTRNDARSRHQTAIESLITTTQKDLETLWDRKLEETTFTNVLFQHGLNCEIYEEQLFLKSQYRDIKSFSAITEIGTSLTAVTDYNDGNDYYHDKNQGILIRHEAYWSAEPFAIKASGILGLVDDECRVYEDIRGAMVELVALKSGLWKQIVQTQAGSIDVNNGAYSKSLRMVLERYRWYDA